jgi:hypothetical protein
MCHRSSTGRSIPDPVEVASIEPRDRTNHAAVLGRQEQLHLITAHGPPGLRRQDQLVFVPELVVRDLLAGPLFLAQPRDECRPRNQIVTAAPGLEVALVRPIFIEKPEEHHQRLLPVRVPLNGRGPTRRHDQP